MSKKIALIANIPSFLILFRHELVVSLVQKGYQVYCFAYGYTAADESVVRGWGAIPVNHFVNVRGMNPWHDLKGVYHLYKEFRSIQPDIVFSCFVKPVIFATMAAKLARVPRVIGMIEGLGNAFTPSRKMPKYKMRGLKGIQVLLYKLSIPMLDKLILLNKDDQKDLIETYHIETKDTQILGGIGVDLNKFQYLPPNLSNPTTFLFVGRLVEAKGIFEFIEAAKIIKTKYPDVIFRVIGGLDEHNPFSVGKDALTQYIDSGLIEYKGHVQDVISEMRHSHVFVLPSYREGVPRSTQEAMSIGRPVITTDVPGCRETVRDKVNGFLVPLWDIEALADRMEYFILFPNQISLMGEKSRQMAERMFDIETVNNKIMEILA